MSNLTSPGEGLPQFDAVRSPGRLVKIVAGAAAVYMSLMGVRAVSLGEPLPTIPGLACNPLNCEPQPSALNSFEVPQVSESPPIPTTTTTTLVPKHSPETTAKPHPTTTSPVTTTPPETLPELPQSRMVEAAQERQREYDISWPQCATNTSPELDPAVKETMKATPGRVIVGTTHGQPFTNNYCLKESAAAAGELSGLYVMVGFSCLSIPKHVSPRCRDENIQNDAKKFGAMAGRETVMYAMQQLGKLPLVWGIDVEHGPAWSKDTAQNADAVKAEIEAIRATVAELEKVDPAAVQTLIYSNVPSWKDIIGNHDVGEKKIWFPTAQKDINAALPFCAGVNTKGQSIKFIPDGNIVKVQYGGSGEILDQNGDCYAST